MFKKIILLGLMALGLLNVAEAQFTPQNPNASQSTVTATGTTTARTLAARASDVANVLDYGAYGDAVRTQTSVTTTSGSPTATISGISSSYVGANIVIGGAGSPGISTATVSSGGTGYAANDTITLAGGTFTTAAILKVLTVSSGVISTVEVINAGVYSVTPTGTISQASTSGSGTGATFTVTLTASPLQTTIVAVSGTTITLGTTALNTLSNVSEYVAFGHDDAPGIQAAMNSGATMVIFPADHKYGQYSQITLPNANRVVVNCQGSTIVALASMSAQMYQTANSNYYASQGSVFENCQLDALGQATNNISHGSFRWSFINNVLLNATGINFLLSGGNTYVTNLHIDNFTSVVPTYPSYLIKVTSTDNHFTDVIVDGGVSGILDNSNANFWTNIHTYYVLGTHYNLAGAGARCTEIYADTVLANQIGINVTNNQISIDGWLVGGPSTAIGVNLASGASYNTVTGGVATGGITADNTVIQYNASTGTSGNNTVIGNSGSYTAMNGGSACFGFQVRCYSNTAIAMGSYAAAAYGAVAIGGGANANNSGSVTIGQNSYANASNAFSIGTSITVANANEMSLDNIWIGYTTAPTVTSGLGTSPTVTSNGTHVFKVTVGATGTPSTTAVIGMPTAPTDWVCPHIVDRTTTSVTGNQTGSASTTSFTVTFNTAPSNSDVLLFMCDAM